MYTGEKLTSLSNIIYDFAKRRLEAARLDNTLAEFVMRDVHRRFLDDAYAASLLRQLTESVPKDEKKEDAEHTDEASDCEKE